MDPARRKRVAAAVAGLFAFLEETAAAQAATASAPAEPTPPPAPGPSAWALTGRHDAMFLRTLWQRRIARPA